MDCGNADRNDGASGAPLKRGEETQMTLDIHGLPEDELTGQIHRRCAQFGAVKSVEVRRAERGATYQFAVVRMSTYAQAEKLFDEWGVAKNGDSVVIRLTQRMF